jgi:hypothetical protein
MKIKIKTGEFGTMVSPVCIEACEHSDFMSGEIRTACFLSIFTR